MPAGSEGYDASGVQTYDATRPVAKVLGGINIGYAYTGTTLTGSVYCPEFTTMAGHTPWFERVDGGHDSPGYHANVWISGQYLYWEFPNAQFQPEGSYDYGVL